MVTPQQSADLALQQWQALRALPPEQRIEELMRSFFLPPIEMDMRYQDQLNAVTEAMSDA